MSRRPKAVLVGPLAVLALLGACGSGERAFTAEQFVDAINEEGAGVALGPVISTNPDDAAVHSISFTEATADVGSPGAGSSDADRGSGTLLIVDDAGTARDEFDRCEGAPELTCFRAANAVLRFEEMDGADQARIVTSLEGIQTPPD